MDNQVATSRAAAQAAQEANAQHCEELAKTLIQEWGAKWGPNANFDKYRIKVFFGFRKINSTVQGIYAAIKRLLEREPDQRSEAQVAQETSLEALWENDYVVVLMCLTAMGEGMQPSMSYRDIGRYMGVASGHRRQERLVPFQRGG